MLNTKLGTVTTEVKCSSAPVLAHVRLQELLYQA